MFEKLDKDAVKVIMLAQQEAAGCAEIGTEHLLLGLIGAGGDIAQRLSAVGVHSENAHREVEKTIPCDARVQKALPHSELSTELLNRLSASGINVQNAADRLQQAVPFADAAKRVLEQSWQEAKDASRECISPRHILVALIRQDEGSCTKILKRLGVDVNQLQNSLKE